MSDTNDDIHMIEQPLFTEDGFLNEACINELGAAIANIPPTHERLSGEPEWNRKRITTRSDITGAFAKASIQISPYGYPDDLEIVVRYLDACLNLMVKWKRWVSPGLTMAELSLCDINRLLHEILMDKGVSQFDAWNARKREPTRKEQELNSTDRDPDTDFIDLNALLHNTCLDIRMERRAFDAFNAEFDREHGIKASEP